MAALFHTRLSPFLSVIFHIFIFPQNLLVARKPVSVVACPSVAPSFARYVVMVITSSDCFFNVVWDLFLCFVTVVAAIFHDQNNFRNGSTVGK